MNDHNPPQQARGQRTSFFWLLVACGFTALLIACVIAFFRPLPEETNGSPSAAMPEQDRRAAPTWVAEISDTSSGPNTAEQAAPSPPSSTAAAVTLPKAQVPATAEALEQEARQVAVDLRNRYPDSAEALHVAAMLHAQVRETEQAESLWQQAVAKAPDVERYSVNLAALALERGDHDLAVKTLRRLVDQGSTSADVLHHLGLALSNAGEAEKAAKLLHQAVTIYPQSSAHWLVLGQAQLQQGDAEAAETSLQKARQLGADSAELYFHLANASRRLGKKEEAAEYQEQFQERKETAPVAADQRFEVLSAAEARGTAVAILIESASVHAKKEDTVRAETQLLRALALQPHSVAACRSLADLYQREKTLAEEQVVRERLTELEPFRFDNHLALAKVCSQRGQWERAEGSLKLALAQQPQAAIGYVALAEFYYQARMGNKARWYAQEAVRRFPSAEGYRFLAETCRMAGDDESAAEATRMAEALQHGSAASNRAAGSPESNR